eukprot:Platyproteum_vivax@DN3244_c0_g2_i1.p1
MAYPPNHTSPSKATYDFFASKAVPLLTVVFSCAILLTAFPLFIVGLNPRLDEMKPVDRDACRCGCWDTLTNNGIKTRQKYQSLYMNMDLSMGWLLMHTIFFVLVSYSAATVAIRAVGTFFRHTYAGASDCEKTTDLAAVLLFVVACVYPVFYGFWCIFNDINTRRYNMMFHQHYFYLTEMLVAVCVLELFWVYPERASMQNLASVRIEDPDDKRQLDDSQN